MTQVHFNKYGISDDKKYIMAIGSSTAPGEKEFARKMGASIVKSVFKNKCPFCGKATLAWGFKYSNLLGEGSDGSGEGHIYCIPKWGGCDADFGCVTGREHKIGSNKYLTKVTKSVKSSRSEAMSLQTSGGTYDLDNLSGGSSDTSNTSCKDYTKGFDIENPFKAYIAVDYGYAKDKYHYNPKGKTKTIYIDFTADSNVQPKGFSGLSPSYVNNAVRSVSCNILPYIKSVENDNDGNYQYFLKKIRMVYDVPNGDKLYEADGSDNSSNKILLKKVGIEYNHQGNPKTFDSCGQKILDNLNNILKESDYKYKMVYSDNRKDDTLNFFYNPSDKPVFTIREDDDRFIGLNSIEYTPIENTYNASYRIYKDTDKNENSYYNYTVSRHPVSVFKYGEKVNLETLDNTVSSSEAYYKARYDNNKYNQELNFNFSVEWEGVPPIGIGDYVECVMDNIHYTDIKEVKSLSYKCSNSDACNIRTTIGLGHVDPMIRLKRNMRNIRNSAKKKRTSYTGGAVYDTSTMPFVFE